MSEEKHPLIGKEFPVLSHGSIMLVDYMGSDQEIEEAARVSYGEGTRPVSATNTLLRYLRRKNHSSPFEQAELKFKIKMPMDVNRQWIRHRTACLAGDVKLHFSRWNSAQNKFNRLHKVSVKDIYDRFQPTTSKTNYHNANHYYKRDLAKCMYLRQIDESTKELRYTHIVDIWESGEKVIFEVQTESGKTLKCSKDHKIFTKNGWKTLKQLKNGDEIYILDRHHFDSPENIPNKIDEKTEEWLPILDWEDYYEISNQGRVKRIAGGRGVRDLGRCKTLQNHKGYYQTSINKPGTQSILHVHREVARAFIGEPDDADGLYVCHKDGNSLNNNVDNLYWGTSSDNACDRIYHHTTTRIHGVLDKIVSIKSVGKEMTYDLEVEGPYHNFCANDIIVHNSVNEYSTRYSLPIDDTDTTEVWRLQSKDNKQGSCGEVTEWPEGYDLEKNDYSSPSEFLSDCEAGVIEHCKSFYDVTQDFGVAKEVARKNLTLSTYTELFWKCDLHNIMHFLMLRCDSHAQLEIRKYANVMAGIVQELFPLSYQAWYDYQFKGEKMSRMEMQILQTLLGELDEEQVKDLARKFGIYKDSDKSHREFDEFLGKFNQDYTDKGEFKLGY